MELSLYKSVARPLLFLTPPETAHGIARWFFRRRWLWQLTRGLHGVENERLRVTVGHLELPNPVGLAAGFDKDCDIFPALSDDGFGYVTPGTVTLEPREGNPKPRLFRYPKDSLVNSMGFPNPGAERAARNLSKHRLTRGKLIASVSGLSIEEFAQCFRRVEPFADGVELNISTPNTEGVRIFQETATLGKLLNEIAKLRTPGKAVWVKLPPYFNEKERESVLGLVETCRTAAVDAVTAINTKRVNEPRTKTGIGGLSGRLIFQDMLRVVSDIAKYTGGKIPINACGGISSGLDAWRAFELGASSVQLYTALVYEGPGVVSKINRTLVAMLKTAGSTSLSQIVGTGLR